MRLSPLDPRNFHNRFEIGLSLLGARRYEEALEWVDQSLREQPRFAAAVRVKLSLCGHLERAEEGGRCLARLTELQPGLTIAAFTAHARTFLSDAVTEIFVEGLRKAGLPEEVRPHSRSPARRRTCRGGFNRTDAAIAKPETPFVRVDELGDQISGLDGLHSRKGDGAFRKAANSSA